MGLSGLRVSSLTLLENIGGRLKEGNDDGRRDDGVVNLGVCEILCRHTMKQLPQGLWDKSEEYCREICYVAGVHFDESAYCKIYMEEAGEREDEEFDD